MFEHLTADVIFERMLAHVDDKLDKRKGSFIWISLRPVAIEFRLHYLDLEMVLRNSFARTADRQHLVMRAEESSIFPLPATKTRVEGRFNVEVPLGARFNKDKHNFKVLESLPDTGDDFFYYLLESEDAGVITQDLVGSIIPITATGKAAFIQDLETAEIVSVLRPGEDAEETEAFRSRYFRENKWEHYGGNIADYEVMVAKVAGVGAVKVIPVWDGPGTVKLVILDSAFETPSPELVAEVKEEIDPEDYSGMRVGKAPINHHVTIEGATPMPLNTHLPIVYEEGYRWELVEASANETLEAYLQELRQEWESSQQLVARIAFIETRILNLPGVLDIQNVTINGLPDNVILGPYEVPVLGEVTAT